MASLTASRASLLIIVDYNNAVKIREGENFKSVLLNRLSEILDLSLATTSHTNFIDLRLYGGWLEEGIFTAAASKISQVIESEPFFPLIGVTGNAPIRGRIQMPASSIANPNQRWTSMYRQGAGASRLQLCTGLDMTTCDTVRDQCPIHVLRRFSRKRGKQCPVDACDRTNANVFRQSKQKKVDVMMAADIITAASGIFERFESIIVFSDDTDLYPALADATAHHDKVLLFKPRQNRDDGETSMLRSLGVDVRLAQ